MLVLSSADFFPKSNYLKISFRITIRVNILDPDQARHSVGLDLGPNCLQRLSADDTCRQIVNRKLCKQMTTDQHDQAPPRGRLQGLSSV